MSLCSALRASAAECGRPHCGRWSLTRPLALPKDRRTDDGILYLVAPERHARAWCSILNESRQSGRDLPVGSCHNEIDRLRMTCDREGPGQAMFGNATRLDSTSACTHDVARTSLLEVGGGRHSKSCNDLCLMHLLAVRQHAVWCSYGARPDFLGQVEDMPYEETHYNHVPLPQVSKHELPGAQQPCAYS